MGEKKVSIIIPAYNTEAYIEECIHSVQEQTYSNYEIIIINDGSTDSTLKILEEYRNKHDYIKVINIENHGQGYARNLGIKQAQGDYILFLDSDDLLRKTALEDVVSIMEKDKSDMVFFNWSRFQDATGKKLKVFSKPFMQREILEEEEILEMLRLKAYFPVMSLYSREFLLKNNIKFLEGHIYEDVPFVVSCISVANRVSILNKKLYIIRIRHTSTTKTDFTTDKHSKGFITAVKVSLEIINKSKYSSEDYYYFYEYVLRKFIAYGGRRVTGIYLKEFRNDIVDLLSCQKMKPFKEARSRLLKILIYTKVFANRKYKMFSLFIWLFKVNRYLRRKRKRLIRKFKNGFKRNIRVMSVTWKRVRKKKGITIKFKKETTNTFLQKLKKQLYNSKVNYYRKLKINEKKILFDSKLGGDLAGNMFYLLQEIKKNYPHYQVNIVYNSVNAKNKIKSLLNQYALTNIRLINRETNQYIKSIHKSKYLFTDSTFPAFYCKRNNQILINTWHGTPLKKMGRDIPNGAYNLFNVQRNFIASDYLVYPSKRMEDIMLDAYMVRNLTKAKLIEYGYPRNSIFLNEKRAKQIKEELNLKNKYMMVYMPTWREPNNDKELDQEITQTQKYLKELDNNLTDDYVVYIKLHVFVGSTIDCSKFKHIRSYPINYEAYDFLNVADCLITDYSSVFFDYANSKKKIILFTYDKEEYLSKRGIYFDFDKLPFPQVDTVQELVREIKKKSFNDYSEFVAEFCKYDNDKASEKICKYIFNNMQDEKYEINIKYNNGKKNILIDLSTYKKCRMLEMYNQYASRLNSEEYNYYFLFTSKALKKNTEISSEISKEYCFVTYESVMKQSFGDNFKKIINSKKMYQKLAVKEARRMFSDTKFDLIVSNTSKEHMKNVFSCIGNKVVSNINNIKEELE